MKGVSKKQKDKAVAMYLDRTDLSVYKIARMCDMSATTLFHTLHDYGCAKQRVHGGDDKDENLLVDSKEERNSKEQAIVVSPAAKTVLSVDVADQLKVKVEDVNSRKQEIEPLEMVSAEREELMEDRKVNEAVSGNNLDVIIEALSKIIVELTKAKAPVEELEEKMPIVSEQASDVEIKMNSAMPVDGDVKPKAILWIL